MENITRVTKKGQVTVPLKYRKRFGITENTKMEFYVDPDREDVLVVKPIRDFISFKGVFSSRKKYTKESARRAYIGDVLKGKV